MTLDLRRRRSYRCAMRRCVAAVMVVLWVTACGSGHAVQHAAPGPTPVAGGCGTSALHRGQLPTWAQPAFADSSTRSSPWPFAVARQRNVIAVEFGYPLQAGAPRRKNKVLWIMRQPRHGMPLIVTARPARGGGPVVRATWPADSSPGEIYPSYVNVPHAGCWRVTLHWAHHTDSVDLSYRA